MNISGVGYRMDTGITTRQYNNLNPSMGAVDRMGSSSKQNDDPAGVSSMDFSLKNVDTAKAVANMDRDQELKEFAVFVRSGETPAANTYSEDWMRPVENFAL